MFANQEPCGGGSASGAHSAHSHAAAHAKYPDDRLRQQSDDIEDAALGGEVVGGRRLQSVVE